MNAYCSISGRGNKTQPLTHQCGRQRAWRWERAGARSGYRTIPPGELTGIIVPSW